MTGCLLIGASLVSLAASDFTLRWTHSVEKIEWVETYRIDGPMFHLTRVAIKGSGAGMEPADDARLEHGWYVWNPDVTLPSLTLAASGATGSGWHLCSGAECREIGSNPGAPLTLRPCGG